MLVDVLIPALNEEAALPTVLDEIPRELVRRIVVIDNGSTDGTAAVARERGAEVVVEPERGYGAACLAGIAAIAGNPPDVVVFLDGDRSDHPRELPRLLAPIASGRAELVIGSRVLGGADAGSLTPQQRMGNAIAASLLRAIYRVPATDLGPFRAIRWSTLRSLGLRDRTFGWTVEMQLEAARRGVAMIEVPVSYRRRIGHSKISGTVRGTLGAAHKISLFLARHALLNATERGARPS